MRKFEIHGSETFEASDPVLAKRLCDEYKRRLMKRGCTVDSVDDTQNKAQFHYLTKKGKWKLVTVHVRSNPKPTGIPWMEGLAEMRKTELNPDDSGADYDE